jgi:EF hand
MNQTRNTMALSVLIGACALGNAFAQQTPPSAPSSAMPAASGTAPVPRSPHHHPGGHHHAGFMFWFKSDRDGSISRTELLEQQKNMLEEFDKADLNHDGKLSREELHAWKKSMHEKWPEHHPMHHGGMSSAPADATGPAGATAPAMPPATPASR